MTRDSAAFGWWVAVVGSIAVYFAAGGDPRVYDFQQWMQALVAVCGIVTAKLGTSPLRSKWEKARRR